MSLHGDAATPEVRRRLVLAATIAALTLAMASLVNAQLKATRRADLDAGAGDDPGIVLAPKVTSRSTSTAVLINITAPKEQPPGVIYTVTRMTRTGLATVCTGRAPLRCTDPVGVPDTPVSYTISSTLTGRGTATTVVDATTAPERPRPTVASRPTNENEDDRSGNGDATVSSSRTTRATKEAPARLMPTPTSATASLSPTLSTSPSSPSPPLPPSDSQTDPLPSSPTESATDN